MAKLVILNQGMTGRTFDLNVERTTVGRVEDNTFQITDGSVSSHHAEIQLRGTDIVIKDLNSTNGTFINNDRITESVLKPGQTLRFGQVELKIDDGKPVTAPPPGAPPAPAAPAATPAPAASASKKQTDASTMVISRGVSLSELEQGGARPPGFDTNTAFTKKKNKVNLYFIIGGIAVGILIIALILYAISQASGGGHQ
jgi:pSer/pThr/pTyr-binding forkhead associated (FHA) protein